MTTIPAPYPYFTDASGNALEAGKIYIGTAGLDPRTNPIAVYQDEALTIAWAQPIRTVGGYPVYIGAPSNIQTAAFEFSLIIATSTGEVVFRDLNVVSIDADNIRFIQSGTGAVSRSAQAKMRDFVTPADFGAVGDGTTNDRAALLFAMQSGKPVDGLGLTYAVADEVKPTSFRGLRNATLKWTNTGTMAQQKALLFIENLSNWFVDGCTFDLGTVENTGSADDSTRAGFKTTTTSPNVTFNDNIRVANCRVFGNGNGTGIYVRSCRWGAVENNVVQNRIVAFSPDPTNDCQNGIDVSQSIGMTISGNRINNLQTRLLSVLEKRYNRGILFFETRDSTVQGNYLSDLDQGYDFSGAWDAVTNTNGNVNLTVTGNVAEDVTTWGIKFANVARDIACTGNVVRRFGLGGIVVSPSSVTLSDPTKNTQRILISGNHICDPTNAFVSSNRTGIWIATQPTYTSYPRGIKLIGNTVTDTTGSGFLGYCYRNEVIYDGTSGQFNELIDCRGSGFVTGFTDAGFPLVYCSLSGSGNLSLPNGSTENVLWTAENSDTLAMHSNSVNTNLVTVPIGGWYRVTFAIAFASNATGFRRVRVLRNGTLIVGGQVEMAAVNGAATVVTGSFMTLVAAGGTISLQATQNSGGALDLVRNDSVFDVYLEQTA
jgi:hypothetical protein